MAMDHPLPRQARKPRLKRGRKVRWPIDAERFIEQRKAALLSQRSCSNALGVSERTIRNWEQGRTEIPYSAFKLLRVLTGGELPGEAWRGFWIRGTTLWSPEGKGYNAGELAYLANVFAMARYWLEEYHARAGEPEPGRLD